LEALKVVEEAVGWYRRQLFGALVEMSAACA
jgi:hypothetical protein